MMVFKAGDIVRVRYSVSSDSNRREDLRKDEVYEIDRMEQLNWVYLKNYSGKVGWNKRIFEKIPECKILRALYGLDDA